jgi:hypothetical protein
MIHLDLLDLIHRSDGSKVGLDLLAFVVVLFILWLLFRRRPKTFILFFLIFVVIFTSNELLSVQSIESRFVEDFTEIEILNKSASPFTPKFQTKMIMSIPFIFSGVVQTINMIKGDRKYTLSKTLANCLMINSCEKINYRSYLSTPLPTKVIFLCQHIPYLVDTLPFLAYVPNTHRLTVFNDFTMGGMSKAVAKVFHVMFCKNLYGAHMISRRDKDTLKTQMSDFVDSMINNDHPHVFTIWPSGWAWRYDQPNGVDKFKPGAFYMSAYTNTPVCIIHGKLSKDSKRFIVEQSHLIHPPTISVKEDTYVRFYENMDHRPMIEEYRSNVESIYREMDNKISKLITA